MKLAVAFTVAKLAALLALALALGNCATLKDAWQDDEQSWQQYCAVPPHDPKLVPCSCMDSRTPACPPIPDDDGDNPSLMARKLRRAARRHLQQPKGTQ